MKHNPLKVPKSCMCNSALMTTFNNIGASKAQACAPVTQIHPHEYQIARCV